MPDLTVYRLAFRSGFHVGAQGVNLEETRIAIPSDTLFAALVATFRHMGGDPDDLVAPFPRLEWKPGADEASYVHHSGDPPFRLTSAFPFAGDVRFFPIPVDLSRCVTADTLRSRRKELKRVGFISEAIFRRLTTGERLDDWLFPQDEKVKPTTGVALQKGAFWMTLEEHDHLPEAFRHDKERNRPIPPRALRYRQVFVAAQVPRVTVDRVSAASDIFHAGRVTFAPGCGLWFGIDWRHPEAVVGQDGLQVRPAVERALAVLADAGIGGERSVGYGAFKIETASTPLKLADPAPGDLVLLLSRYHPQSTDLPAALQAEGTAYTLVPIGGWLHSSDEAGQRRKRLWLVAEGSTVHITESAPAGNLVDVRPTYEESDVAFPHPVWRSGLALGAAIHRGGDA